MEEQPEQNKLEALITELERLREDNHAVISLSKFVADFGREKAEKVMELRAQLKMAELEIERLRREAK